MRIVLQYFAGCPNWQTTRDHLATLVSEGLDASIEHEPIESHEEAVEKGFAGSPTVRVDGIDPFAEETAPAGLTCRIYQTEKGPAGTPTLDQLRTALTEQPGRSRSAGRRRH